MNFFSLNLVKPHIWMTYNGEIYNYKRLGKQFKFDYQTGEMPTRKGKPNLALRQTNKCQFIPVFGVSDVDLP